MSLLNDVIHAALRDPVASPPGKTATGPLIDALRSLLAPHSMGGGATPNETHLEPDALQQLLARFEQSGYANIIRSWIGTGPNQTIQPQQLGHALGEDKVNDLERQTGLPRSTLLDTLARLLPTVIDRLTPQGNAPTVGHSEA